MDSQKTIIFGNLKSLYIGLLNGVLLTAGVGLTTLSFGNELTVLSTPVVNKDVLLDKVPLEVSGDTNLSDKVYVDDLAVDDTVNLSKDDIDLTQLEIAKKYEGLLQYIPREEEFYEVLRLAEAEELDPNEVYPYFDLIYDGSGDYYAFVNSFLSFIEVPPVDFYEIFQLLLAGDTIHFRAKSFISKIPLPQIPPAGANGFLFNQFVNLTNSSFSETAAGKSYRIEGDLTLKVLCHKGTLVTWDSSGVTPGNKAVEPPNLSAAAKAFAALWNIKVPLSVAAGIVKTPYGKKSARQVGNTIELDWAVFGAPHATGIKAMNFIAKKQADHIWHRVEATVSCQGDKAVVTSRKLTGTKFPAHALFIDTKLVSQTVQGPVSTLWSYTAGDTFLNGKKSIKHLPSASKTPAYFKK